MKILGLIGLMFLVGCSETPRYKVGDCVVTEIQPYKIIGIGENHYVLKSKIGQMNFVLPIRHINDYPKMNCKEVGF